MKVTAIRDPFFGEQLLAVDPPLEPRVEADWRRRLSLYPGRSLSAEALSAAQRNIGGRLPLLGRTLSPGVIEGLEPALEVDSGEDFLHLAPGVGLTAAGEDVVMTRPLRVPVESFRVYAPEYLLDGTEPPATNGSLDDLFPRRLGPPLGELSTQDLYWQRALVLVLQPIAGESLENFDGDEACERDPRNEAYEDQRLVDGARLVLYAWPTEWLGLLAPLAPPDFDQSLDRNQIAHLVFEAEGRLEPGEIMPWEAVGLPVGVLVFDLFLENPTFVDRHTVVRAGGEPLRPGVAAPGARGPFLWQARIEQFAEHLADLLRQGISMADAGAFFPRRPPVGLLPAGAVDFDAGQQGFFPADGYRVEAVPVPLEQLDTVIRATASLERFGPLFSTGFPPVRIREDVRILVPVPQVWYEPRLLIEEDMDPLFKHTVDDLAAERNEWRGRRDDVRSKLAALTKALGGEELTFPDPDPDAQPGEMPSPGPFDPPEQDYDVTFMSFPPGIYVAFVNALEELRVELIALPLPTDELQRLNDLGLVLFLQQLQSKVKRINDFIDLSYVQVHTNIFKMRQFMLGSIPATRTGVEAPLGPIAEGESVAATRPDLEDLLWRLGEPVESPVLSDGSASVDGAAKSAVPQGGGDPQSPPVDPRDFPIHDRLLLSMGVETQKSAVFAKYKAATAFIGEADLLEIVSGLELPGFARGVDGNGNPIPTTFGEIAEDESLREDIRNGVYDPTTGFYDEGDYFSGGVKTSGDGVGILQVVERHLEIYDRAIELCRETLPEIRMHRIAAQQRLEEIDARLAEARHDMAVGLSLFAEEQQRIDELNARRRQILEREVPFLLFHRPRLADNLAGMPVRRLYPAPAADPVPLCLGREVEAPPQLAQMLDLLRAAPIDWFPGLRPLLAELKRLDELWGSFQDAQHAAATLAVSFFEPSIGPSTGGPAEVADGGSIGSAPNVAFMARLATAGDSGAGVAADGAFAGLEEGLSPVQVVDQAIGAQTQVLADQRFGVANLDLGPFQDYNWGLLQQEAPKILSFGDLMNVGRRSVARKAVAAFEDLGRVAACLYAGFSTVRPSRRLSWVQLLSQYDAPFDLRWLATLPGWEQLGFLERRELQALVDWLFQRVDPEQADAVAWINDLVRVCILLASSAPVDRLVAASVIVTTSVQVGGTVQVELDAGDVYVGATALFYGFDADGNTVATGRGVVVDLAREVAVVRLDQAVADTLRLEAGARVEVTGTSIFTGSPPIAGSGGLDPTL